MKFFIQLAGRGVEVHQQVIYYTPTMPGQITADFFVASKDEGDLTIICPPIDKARNVTNATYRTNVQYTTALQELSPKTLTYENNVEGSKRILQSVTIDGQKYCCYRGKIYRSNGQDRGAQYSVVKISLIPPGLHLIRVQLSIGELSHNLMNGGVEFTPPIFNGDNAPLRPSEITFITFNFDQSRPLPNINNIEKLSWTSILGPRCQGHLFNIKRDANFSLRITTNPKTT